MQTQLLPSLISFIASLAAFLFRTNAKITKCFALAACLLMLAVEIYFNSRSLLSISTILLATLMALVCILSQATNKSAAISTALILAILGLTSLFLLDVDPLISKLAQGILTLSLVILSFRFRKKNVSLGFGSAAALSISMLSLLLSSLVHGTWSVICQITAAAVLLPLFPLHVGYIGLLNNLPGTVPAFLSFILPIAGLHALVQVQEIPPLAAEFFVVTTIIGLFISGARAFVQTGLMRIIAAVASILLAPVWWICSANGKLGSENCSYIIAVGLVVAGLSLCAHCVESRYGTQSLESLPGLAKKMPKLGIAFSLLTMAGLGIPTFAIFSSFILPQFSPLQSRVSDLLFVSLAWFICFALQISVLQRLLFNEPRADLLYSDLNRSEFMSLAIILVLLLIGGIFPGVMLALTT
ncbi:MAG: hypothetical protein K2X27_26380 [Candidatus Obscuribacterales bacterium]|nr:hypothetical protein [Candidatus Obscuribacterales bacterium]